MSTSARSASAASAHRVAAPAGAGDSERWGPGHSVVRPGTEDVAVGAAELAAVVVVVVVVDGIGCVAPVQPASETARSIELAAPTDPIRVCVGRPVVLFMHGRPAGGPEGCTSCSALPQGEDRVSTQSRPDRRAGPGAPRHTWAATLSPLCNGQEPDSDDPDAWRRPIPQSWLRHAGKNVACRLLTASGAVLAVAGGIRWAWDADANIGKALLLAAAAVVGAAYWTSRRPKRLSTWSTVVAAVLILLMAASHSVSARRTEQRSTPQLRTWHASNTPAPEAVERWVLLFHCPKTSNDRNTADPQLKLRTCVRWGRRGSGACARCAARRRLS